MTERKKSPSAEIRKRPTSAGFRAVSVKANGEGEAVELHVGVSKSWIVSVIALSVTVIGSILGWLSLREERIVHEVKTEMRAVKAEVKRDAEATITNAKLLISGGMIEIHKANKELQKAVVERQDKLRDDLVREMRRVRRAVQTPPEEGP